jgi:hypothetical protein
VLKYTSYAILDPQTADVMQPVVFVFLLFHNNKDKTEARYILRLSTVVTATAVDRHSINQPLVLKPLVV